MVSMIWLWLRHRQRGVLAVAAVLLAVAAVVFIVRGGSIGGVAFLGNTTAPRAEAQANSGAVLPRAVDGVNTPSLLDKQLPTNAGPQSVETAQAAWSAEDIERLQAEVLTGFNCTRAQANLPPLKLDVALSQTAGNAWLKLVHDPKFTLMSVEGNYTARGVLALDITSPDQVTAQARQGQAQQGVATNDCKVGGFDPATMSAEETGVAIGIAVFPPQASWDSASAVVLVR
jgi:hypothetical protein